MWYHLARENDAAGLYLKTMKWGGMANGCRASFLG